MELLKLQKDEADELQNRDLGKRGGLKAKRRREDL